MFRIEDQPFDSGRIARKVGVVSLENGTGLPNEAGAAICESGRRSGYDLLTLEAGAPVDLAGFEARGVALTLEGRLDDVAKQLSKLRTVAHVRPIEGRDWPIVEDMLRWAGRTRFTSDPRIPGSVARVHKLAMLREVAETRPGCTLVAAVGAAGAPLAGLQSSYLTDDAAVFYEIMVDPERRSGFVASGLLAEGARRLRQLRPGGPVRARIYLDNTPSIKLFTRVGMSPTGREDHHYHAWLGNPAADRESS